jgi:hypothetical protein
VDQAFFLGCDDFDKLEFLDVIHDVRTKALKESTIKSAWKRASLIPYDPCLVIKPLKQQVRTPSPSPLPEQFPTPESAAKLKTTIDSLWRSCPDLSGAPEFKFWLKKLARGSMGIAHAASHLSTSLEATRAAEKRRQKLKAEGRRSVDGSGLIKAGIGHKMVHRNKERRLQEMAKKWEHLEKRAHNRWIKHCEKILVEVRKEIRQGFKERGVKLSRKKSES